MDVVYPLGGKREAHRQQEIRYAIRALLQHSQEPIGRIYIVGEKPEFFEYGDRVVHIEWNEEAIAAKELRIWYKVLIAAEVHQVSDDFLLSSDDHFFCSDFTPSTFPNYSNGRLSTKPWNGESIVTNGYDLKSRRTLQVLKAHRLEDHFFDIHCPKVINKRKFINCYDHFSDLLWATSKEKHGSLLIKTTYCNFVEAEVTRMDDVKIKPSQISWLKENYEKLVTFSLFDKARNDEMFAFLKKLYPVPAPFENDGN